MKCLKNAGDIEKILIGLGYASPIAGGAQLNIAAGKVRGKKGKEGTYCDNPRCEYGYVCPVSTEGVDPSTFAPAKYIVKGAENIYNALLLARKGYLGDGFDDVNSPFAEHVKIFKIPEDYARATYNILEKGYHEGPADFNLIGGKAEKHNELGEIISGIQKNKRAKVALTTTGSEIMLNPDVADKILSRNPPNVLALSADHPRGIEFCSYSLDKLMDEYNWIINHEHSGQERKTLEAIYALKLMQEEGKYNNIGTLFNIVLSSKNINDIYQMIDAYHENFENMILNLYPGHSFGIYPLSFNNDDIGLFDKFVDYMIEKQKEQKFDSKKTFVPRIAHWLSEKAALSTYKGKERLQAASGHGIWSCEPAGLAGPYIQVGKDESSTSEVAGNHLACLWTASITNPLQVHDATPEQIVNYLIETKKNAANKKDLCTCDMPRLEADGLRTEAGLVDKLWEAYLKERSEHAGF